MSSLKFLIADNDPNGMLQMQSLLEKEFSATVEYCHNSQSLIEKASNQDVNILFYDLAFDQNSNPISTLRSLNQTCQNTIIIPLIPIDNNHLIKDVLGLQLFFYITKPFNISEFQITLRRAIETQILNSPQPTETIPISNGNFQGMIGQSAPMQQLFDVIERVADDDFSTVLIRGESGTGKEMVAKAIHNASSRSSQNFVPVNCAAIPDELLESELFGYTKGAFTGATSNKIGRIQYSHLGTLFLDEIGDMKPSLQAKLLRVIQEREFEPVGGFKTIPVDTRILAATHCNLEQMVKEGLFREDLYYRLSVIPLEIAPLRHRHEDIPLLIEKFIETYTTKRGKHPFSFSAEAMDSLLAHKWHGNVRELENLVQHMSVLYAGDIISIDRLPFKFQHTIPSPTISLTEEINTTLEEVKTPVSEFDNFVDERNLLFGDNDLSNFAIEEKEFGLSSGFDNEEPAKILQDNNKITMPDVIWCEEGVDFKALVGEFENALIIHALKHVEGNKKSAAKLLGLKRTTLLEKIKKKGLQDCWLK